MGFASNDVRVGIIAFGLDRPATGIARYAVELIRSLELFSPDIRVFLLKPFDEPIVGLPHHNGSHRLFAARRLHGMMTLGAVQMATAATRLKLDVIHDPIGVSPFIYPRLLGRFGRIVTIHDAIPFIHPESASGATNFLFHEYIPRTLRFVDHIVTASDSSKRDIERYFNAPEKAVSRIYCGVSPKFSRPSPEVIASVLDRYRISGPYLLTVGALESRKNIEILFQAFSRLRSEGMVHSLVVVGQRQRQTEGILRLLRELELQEAVIFTAYVDDDDLPAIYAGADCFVFPSIYEGFGLPPLEAMSCGTPVITSNSSSLPEVVGDAGIMVDVRDVAGLAKAINTVVSHPEVGHELARKGRLRAQQFTWERAAAEHVQLYRSLAREVKVPRP